MRDRRRFVALCSSYGWMLRELHVSGITLRIVSVTDETRAARSYPRKLTRREISMSGSRISNEMRAEPFYFRGNGGDIDSEVNYGFMRG